jgi:hypothetical protein
MEEMMTLQKLLMLKDVVDNHKHSTPVMVVCSKGDGQGYTPPLVTFTPKNLKLFTKEQLTQMMLFASQVSVNDHTITFNFQ